MWSAAYIMFLTSTTCLISSLNPKAKDKNIHISADITITTKAINVIFLGFFIIIYNTYN